MKKVEFAFPFDAQAYIINLKHQFFWARRFRWHPLFWNGRCMVALIACGLLVAAYMATNASAKPISQN